jgi:hypothetical protein
VDRIVLVHHVDSLTLEGELDVDGTTAIVCGQPRSSALVRLVLTVLTIHFHFVLFLHVPLAVPVLHAVFAYIFKSSAVAAFFALR